MNQQYLAPALDEVERNFLYEHRNSEHFRVFQKAIIYLYSLDCARLSLAKQEELPMMQGRLQGLMAAKNLLALGKFPENK